MKVNEIEKYLNNITTLSSSFTQVAPNGTISSGRFFLSRPGKIRWQYDPPVPQLIVANDGVLAYYDFELDEVSHVSMDRNVAGLLARANIELLDDDMVIGHYLEEANTVKLNVYRRDNADDGKITMVFSDNPMVLKKLEIEDATKQVTNISLNNVQFGIALEDSLFKLDDRGVIPKRREKL
jgi:outer membrane lipoprotein-sorting protein